MDYRNDNDTENDNMAKRDGEGGGVTPPLAVLTQGDPSKEQIAALGLALNEFVRLNPFMPVSQVVAFLLAALESDIGVKEIERRVCVKKSTASKWLVELAQSRIDGDGNYGLIERRTNPENMREVRFQLTRKGRSMVHRVLAALTANGGAK